MFNLSELKDTSRPPKKVQRIGRGIGSHRGGHSGKGGKGDSHRSGYRKRFGYEGGQVPLYRKLPIRGFTRGLFAKPKQAISFAKIDQYYGDGETVNLETLREKGLIPRRTPGGIKILAVGELTKKVKIEAHSFSESAKQKLDAQSISYINLSQASEKEE
ncbi:MAG TPA: 50S ribosomal protein L15 [Chlamydiales bacterium]|jgi:large subunit ribosomal protein L15|nr:50S ribosomal protein L15 [Chlamydiales bacterium]